MTSRYLRLASIPFLALFAASLSYAQPDSDLAHVVLDVRRLLEDGKVTAALELLDNVSQRIDLLATENLTAHEEYLWERARLNTKVSDDLPIRAQFLQYARVAHTAWRDYIAWYDNLTPDARRHLPQQNRRIKQATAYLGNTAIRMEEPRTLFQDYSEIADVEYLGIDAIDLWKSWLYACPGMKPVDISERTPERRRQGICNENCSDDWLSYVTVLSDWVPKERLSVRARQQRQREIQQIRDSAKTCSGP